MHLSKSHLKPTLTLRFVEKDLGHSLKHNRFDDLTGIALELIFENSKDFIALFFEANIVDYAFLKQVKNVDYNECG